MKISRIVFIEIIIAALFSFVFLDYAVGIHYQHHIQQTAWLSGKDFFNHYFSFAGGPGEYLALFLSQYFFIPWAGSLIVSATAAFSVLLLLATIKKFNQEDYWINYFFPVFQVFILALTCNYLFPFPVTLNLFLVLLFLYISVILNKSIRSGIAVYSLPVGILVYYISGGMYFLIFMASSLIIYLRNSWKAGIINSFLIITEALLLPFLAFKFIFNLSLYGSYFRTVPNVAVMLRYEKTPLFWVTLAAIPVFLIIFRLSEWDRKRRKLHKAGMLKEKAYFQKLWINPLIGFLTIVVLSVFLLIHSYHSGEKKKAAVDYYAAHRKWDKVLELAAGIKNYDRMVNFQYNRALGNTGQMLEKLFQYEQILGSQGLFLDRPFAPEVALPGSDLYYDLGNIDESLRLAFEAQTLMPFSPRVLSRLVQDCIILEKNRAAQTYLNVLLRNPVEKKQAERFATVLKGENTNEEIESKRHDLIKSEGILVTPRTKLTDLLKRNPANQAAFEYLVAFDLMEHDLGGFIEDLSLLPHFDYTVLPRVIEEAVLIFRTQRPDIPELKVPGVSNQTVERFRKFVSLTNQNKGNPEKAKLATAEFKDTYWYFMLFLSPLVTNVKVETRPVNANY